MRKLHILTVAVVFALARPLCPGVMPLEAAVPSRMTVQGRLADAGGLPLTPGSKTFVFRIFDAQTLGTQVWPGVGGETQSVTTDVTGLWTADLGALIVLTDAVFASTERWLEITVTVGVNPPQTLSRVKLNATPFTFRIGTVDNASGGTITSDVHLISGQKEIHLDINDPSPSLVIKDPGGGLRKCVYGGDGNVFSAYDANNDLRLAATLNTQGKASIDFYASSTLKRSTTIQPRLRLTEDTVAMMSSPTDTVFVLRQVAGIARVGVNIGHPTQELEIAGEEKVVSAATGIPALDVSSTGFTTGDLFKLEAVANQVADANALEIKIGSGSADSSQFIECARGADVKFRVWANGNATIDGTFTGGGADFAEMIEMTDAAAPAAAGDVMVIDTDKSRTVKISSQPRSTLVAGIRSTKPGFLGSEHEPLAEEIPLAVVGIVPCRVSTENGPIRPGDLLVTAATPGCAMRDDSPRPGTILGKALEPLAQGRGLIRVLVTLQ
ncbi:MAG: hypothetical protein HY304_03595 [candidate division Zixibacteria bacterium]|nr:hypothetical protein [candidate division Zixibacteria bacterium]